jgi:hypothetical protein
MSSVFSYPVPNWVAAIQAGLPGTEDVQQFQPTPHDELHRRQSGRSAAPTSYSLQRVLVSWPYKPRQITPPPIAQGS